jgi:hypothetical protein
MRRVSFLLAEPSKSSISHFRYILMFANPFQLCFTIIFRLVALSVPLIATGFSTEAASLQISSDGWDTWSVPLTTASGDIANSVAPGAGKDIVWSKGTFNHAGGELSSEFVECVQSDSDWQSSPELHSCIKSYTSPVGSVRAIGCGLYDATGGRLSSAWSVWV